MISCRFPIAGRDLNKAVIATFNPLFFEASLSGLSTRRILRVFSDFRLLPLFGFRPIRAEQTIKKSRQFQPQRMYEFFPHPTNPQVKILRDISNVKAAVMPQSMYWRTRNFIMPGLSSGVSTAKLTVEIQMSKRMRLLKPLLFSSLAAASLSGLFLPKIKKIIALQNYNSSI